MFNEHQSTVLSKVVNEKIECFYYRYYFLLYCQTKKHDKIIDLN